MEASSALPFLYGASLHSARSSAPPRLPVLGLLCKGKDPTPIQHSKFVHVLAAVYKAERCNFIMFMGCLCT